MENLTPVTAAAVLTGVELVGDYGAKIGNPLMTYGGYNMLAFTLTQVLKNNSLILTNSYWDGISNVMTTVLGAIVFQERPTVTEWIGITMITAGLFIAHIK